MASNRKLDDLFDDAELPFGHPGRSFDETPAELDQSDDRYGPEPGDPPEEDIIHYGPGDRSLCGNESPVAIYIDEPDQVAGCEDCLELVAEDLQVLGHPVRRLLPPLPPGDHRHRFRRVAAGGPAPMPALPQARLVRPLTP